MTTWKDTAEIIATMFECKEKDIATHLGISPTSFSHIKAGRRPPSDQLNPSWVYRKIFDPTDKNSMAACDPKYATSRQTKPEDIERECLSDLKRIIELKFPNVRYDMDAYWNKEDYKSFVLELIKLSNLGTFLRSPSNNGDEPAPATDMPSDRVSSQTDDSLPPGVFKPIRSPLKSKQPLQQVSVADQPSDDTAREPQAVDESLDSTPAENSQAVSNSESSEAESKAASQVSTAVTGGGAQLH